MGKFSLVKVLSSVPFYTFINDLSRAVEDLLIKLANRGKADI
jgi:hypothetical protein